MFIDIYQIIQYLWIGSVNSLTFEPTEEDHPVSLVQLIYKKRLASSSQGSNEVSSGADEVDDL